MNDPADDLKDLDGETVERMIRKNPIVKFWKEAEGDEMSKDEDLYSSTTECGLYHKISLKPCLSLYSQLTLPSQLVTTSQTKEVESSPVQQVMNQQNLQYLTRNASAKKLELLLTKGANINLPNSQGKAPLMIACTMGPAAMVDRILQGKSCLT